VVNWDVKFAGIDLIAISLYISDKNIFALVHTVEFSLRYYLSTQSQAGACGRVDRREVGEC
jgi:hypothetical protein